MVHSHNLLWVGLLMVTDCCFLGAFFFLGGGRGIASLRQVSLSVGAIGAIRGATWLVG